MKRGKLALAENARIENKSNTWEDCGMVLSLMLSASGIPRLQAQTEPLVHRREKRRWQQRTNSPATSKPWVRPGAFTRTWQVSWLRIALGRGGNTR